MKNKIAMFCLSLSLVSCGVVGEIKTINKVNYTIPYPRETKSNIKNIKLINEKDKSNEKIAYNNVDDEPSRHCQKMKGHSIIILNNKNEYERMCRLDTPNSRVEGSGIIVNEIEYYIANVENKYLPKDNEKEYTKFAKYTRPTKEEVIKKYYNEPFLEKQKELKIQYEKEMQKY